MKKRIVFNEVLPGGILLILLSVFFYSCSKEADNEPEVILTIDLTKPENASLLNMDGFIVFAAKAVMVVNYYPPVLPFIAAQCICPADKNALTWDITIAKFKCPTCQTTWHYNGERNTGPTNQRLTTYKVSKTGNILTISKP